MTNFPGVHIQELPSPVHPITGVPTSIAAFAGWAAQGPTNRAVLVASFADFERQFGGFDANSYLGYAVSQFFENGGQQTYIVRIVGEGSGTAVSAAVGGSLKLWASSVGEWGNQLQVIVTVQPTDHTRFNLLVQLAGTPVESFANLSVNVTDAQYVVNIIDSESKYVTFIDPASDAAPTPPPMPSSTVTAAVFSGGANGAVLNPGDGNFEAALGVSQALASTPLTATSTGLQLLNGVSLFNLLCIPGETDAETIGKLQQYCFEKRALFLADCPQAAATASLTAKGALATTGGTLTPLTGPHPENAAYYYPWVQAPDPLSANRPKLFPPCGFVAGIYASTDTSRGVWKAPAGMEAILSGAVGLQFDVTDAENGALNALGINCLRQFKASGSVVWGARTLQGADQSGSQWKYVPVKRLALFLETSLYNGTKWIVFQPNGEALWAQIRLNVGAFLQGLFVQGAFQGATPQQAYFVKCDAENNPQASLAQGIVNIVVGFAPLYPAEFVITQIQQFAGQ